MANRQYIGARYVPKFADPVEWNNALSYEALTVVTHLGNSFTSKKPVPAGVDIGNVEYWVNTGNYNEQIETYRKETENVAKRIDALSDRSIVFISDSYGVTPNANNSWSALTANYMGIADKCYYGNYSGGGFAVGGSNQFLEALNNVSVADASKITDVVVGGGINDAVDGANVSAIDAGIAAFVSRAKELFPNAKVWIGFMGNAKYGANGVQNLNEVFLLNTIQRYKLCCGMNGATYILNTEQVLRDWANMGDDNIHPNALGADALARVVVATLLGGGYDVGGSGEYVKLTPVVGGTINGSSNENLFGEAYFVGVTGWWCKPTLTFAFQSGIKIGNEFVDIASYKSNNIYCNKEYVWEQVCQVTGDVATTFTTVPFVFRMKQGKLSAKSLYINSGAFEEHNYTSIVIPEKTLVVPIMM